MGNEFGHPEWIDFPREGNGWSHKYARRQWDLVDNEKYLYHDLGLFDKDMIELIKSMPAFNEQKIEQLWDKEDDKVIAYQRADLIFIFNFNGEKSFVDYGILAEKGKYKVVLNTDNSKYGGFNLVDESVEHITVSQPKHESGKEWLMLYLPARTAMVLKKV
jgi:1,4-alpha-glucan branching enzyme